LEAVGGADALVIVTEWKNYRSPNLAALRKSMRSPLVIDGRNLYDPHQLAAAGITYVGIGRNNRALLRTATDYDSIARRLELDDPALAIVATPLVASASSSPTQQSLPAGAAGVARAGREAENRRPWTCNRLAARRPRDAASLR
jgi:hypothetical protein